MNISLQLAQSYSNTNLLQIPVEDILARIGSQLGAVEEVTDINAVYKDVVIAMIVRCSKHPDADKLSVCLIDDGGATPDVQRNDDGYVQVVCGAPNAREGLLVAWLPPGSTVPSTFNKDPFVLGARELRGVMSNGMLASAQELAIGDGHEGILEVDVSAQPGTPFAQAYMLNDVIIDCENKMFTHRPDCFGVLGVARELAGITGQKFISPDWYLNRSNADRSNTPEGLAISSSHKNPSSTEDSGSEESQATTPHPFASQNPVLDKVPRFTAQVIHNVSVQPSDIQMQSWITRLGGRPLNNIVDLTNYYMFLTAQPTHAFDYDKIKELSNGDPTIFPRMAQKGEKLDLINGKTVTLTANDIVIATDTKAVALAGVMGGAETEVDANTKNIIIECATFDMYTVRRTSMRHGIFSDAVTRFNKGQSHLQNGVILNKLTSEILEQEDSFAGERFDSAPEEDAFVFTPVLSSVSIINSRLGTSLSARQMADLLINVEFVVDIENESTSEESIVVHPPFWRKDIEITEDVVEEIGRLYGYTNVDIKLPKRDASPVRKNPMLGLHSQIRNTLAKAGANENLSYTFVSGKLLDDSGQNKEEAYQLSNALSPELQYYRLTLTPSMLSKVNQNIRAGYDDLALFEIGKTHIKLQGVDDDGLPVENEVLGLVYAANDKKVDKNNGAAFYQARNYLDYLTSSLGIDIKLVKIEDQEDYELLKPFDSNRSAIIVDSTNGNYLGVVGEFKESVRKKLKLPIHCAGFEVMLTPILEAHKSNNSYSPLSRFPGISQDITVQVNSDTRYADLLNIIESSAIKHNSEHGYNINIQEKGIFSPDGNGNSDGNSNDDDNSNDDGDGNSRSIKRITFTINLRHMDRTLTTTEAANFAELILEDANKEVEASSL